MSKSLYLTALLAAGVMACAPVWGQEATAEVEGTEDQATASAEATADGEKYDVDAVIDQVEKNEQAHEVKAGILRPIYSLAERFSVPGFHWVAFAVMVTGVVSFAFQLVLGKLVVLSKFSISPSEILSDALGLAVSLIGLVLTTQAAAENSHFTASAVAVISATVVGVLAGLIFYVWGQRQELQAVEGRRKTASIPPAPKNSA